MSATRNTNVGLMPSGRTSAGLCVALGILAMLMGTNTRSLAEPLKIEFQAPGKIVVESSDTLTSEIVEALGHRLGFRLVDRTERGCGTYSGKTSGSLGNVLARITKKECGFLIMQEEDPSIGSQASLVYLMDSNVSSDAPTTVSPPISGMVNRSMIVGAGIQQPDNQQISGETAWERQVRDLARISPRQ